MSFGSDSAIRRDDSPMLFKESITRNGKPLITRLRFASRRWGGLYYHKLETPDAFPPHDHPWTFWSFVISGGYSEAIYSDPTGNRTSWGASMRYADRKRWSLHKMSMDEAHLIFQLEPKTRTLVWRGPRRRVWGFWELHRFRPRTPKEGKMT